MRLRALALVALAGAFAACSPAGAPGASPPASWPAPSLAGGPSWIAGVVTAGPVCPVERNPPEPGCSPRPVPNATIVVVDTSDREVARTTSAASGSYTVAIGRAGTYTVMGLAVAGLMGRPAPVTVTLTSAMGIGLTVDLEYDTGIR